MKKVFISYSHKDEEWKDRLLPHLQTLEQQGDIVVWDDRKIGGGEDWYGAIKEELDQAEVAICLISADYLSSKFINREEIPDLKERRMRDGMLLLPVLLRPCPWKTVQWLKSIQMIPRDGKSLAEIRGEVNQEKALSNIAEFVYEKINHPKFQVPKSAPQWTPPDKRDIDRLPQTGMQLFGRQKELQLLDEMWDSGTANIVSFVAWGGVGKSTLVNRWLQAMETENYRGAKKVFGWSFYSQGTSERATSADKFISEALAWFGDPDPKKGSPWDKGARLADLVRKEKTLLILDGLEPLQSAHDFEKGKIKDPALSMLVTQLARNNNGLCLITTREKVAELERFDEGVLQLNLDQISKEAGRALLRVGGVQGTDGELQAASEQFGNHALAINLLASYLHGIEGHDIENAASIADLDIPEEKGRHPRRVIAAFEGRFGDGPQIQLLNILGLFDRPAEMAAVEAVYKDSPIKGLTDQLQDLTEAQFNKLLEGLRDLKLLAAKSKHNPDVVDCHPLVREHFGEKLSNNKLEAFREAHRRLYEYYKSVPEDELPDTLEEMEPLFAAVTHGCLAGRFQETFNDVYYSRIQRGGKTNFCCSQLGAFGADLAAVSCFFETPWSKPAEGLIDQAKAVVLNFAGFRLRALGRLTEAAEPMKGAIEVFKNEKNWGESAANAGNLSELYLTLGDVKRALEYARKRIDLADRSGDAFQKTNSRTLLGDVLHQSAKLAQAKGLFEKAREMQKQRQPEYPYLYSIQGFRCCDLLLSQGQFKEVQKRASQTLELAKAVRLQLLTLALDNLSLGRAYLLEAVGKNRGRTTDDRRQSEGLERAEDFLNQAVDGLREAGMQDHIPRGLLARTELHRYQQSWPKAQADLEEAKEIAERGQMNLFLADYHIEAARLCLAERQDSEYRILNTECRMEKLNEARQHYEEAARRVDKMGYHRRDPEVLLIKAELEIIEGDKEAAKKTLEEAKKRIDEMGCHRWDVEVERIVKREA